jgi:hypothetical protein
VNDDSELSPTEWLRLKIEYCIALTTLKMLREAQAEGRTGDIEQLKKLFRPVQPEPPSERSIRLKELMNEYGLHFRSEEKTK